MRDQMAVYVDAANLGFEIQVLFVAHEFHEMAHQLFNSSLYFVSSLSKNLVMAVQLEKLAWDSYQASSLPRLTREAMYYFKGQYDYFLIQENDVIVTSSNLLYLEKWTAFFDSYGGNFIPGFQQYELRKSKEDWKFEHSAKYLPSYGFNKVGLYKLKGEYFAQFSYLMVMIGVYTSRSLELLEQTGELFGDLELKFWEPNVHFIRTWQLRHYR